MIYDIKLKRVQKSDIIFLYELLKERNPKANISHKKMPTFSEHTRFVCSKPYKSWYVVLLDKQKIGSVYLSKQDEIGIFLLKEFQKMGIGKTTLELLISKKPQQRYLANVSPKNHESIKFFKNNNFKLIQYTFELIPNYKQK